VAIISPLEKEQPLILQTEDSQNSNYQSLDEEKIGPNNFLPIKILGSGSFGEVYLVKERKTGKLFAMKVLSKERIMGQNLVRYAKTERDVLSYTRHPFIVNLNFAF
jgi:serine/threonine protein kinase